MKKDLLTKEQVEFIAKYLGDISKAIFAVALASKFFGDFALWLRFVLAGVGFACVFAAIWMLPKGGKI